MTRLSVLHLDRLKHEAELLRKQLHADDPDVARSAAGRVGVFPPRGALTTEEILRQRGSLRHKDFLRVIAREQGFDSWQALKEKSDRLNVLREARRDKGVSLLYPRWASAFTNRWHAHLSDARDDLAAKGGYLLTHDRYYFIVTAAYIAELGVDPDDPDWTRIAHDWTSDIDLQARGRLEARIRRAALATT